MIPTTFGISLVLWVLMVSAPGRPGPNSGGFNAERDSAADPRKDLDKDQTQALFRAQYGLDRPVFWNDWIDLDAQTVRDTILKADAPVVGTNSAAKQKATETLEDWGTYSVPPLIELLKSETGKTQDLALYWLRRNATWRIFPSENPVEIEQNRLRNRENYEIAKLKWEAATAPAGRAPVVHAWASWYESQRQRWTHEGWDGFKTRAFDTQFGRYWKNILRLDFGKSHVYKKPVIALILDRIPVTITLSLLSAFIIYLLSIPLGIFSAVNSGTALDRGMSLGLFLLYSLPSFFVGTVLLRSTTVGDPWKWFPTSGFAASEAGDWNTWARLKDVVWHVALPLITLTYGGLAALSRYARTGMLDVLRADYVRTARAKGLSESEVVLRHAARNGMMPVVTLLGGLLPGLIGGSLLVEFIFNLKGMGLLTIEAIQNRDYNVIVAETLIIAVLTQVGILISDLLYAVLDPRIKYK